ncbi:hypothetical protein CFAM422_001778 [Trichoderma lentiforme]|uniref:Uncharacterized protein n=1 Tax=Trichoderma lentiforme TaxID=1567552 RepID=A0A9P5CFU0_9HYPO|nr:hypothetical protein CFAM422_001778 [Trichoderma lentiforme]
MTRRSDKDKLQDSRELSGEISRSSRDTRDMRVCVVHDSVSVPAQSTAQHKFCLSVDTRKRDSETQEKGDEERERESGSD